VEPALAARQDEGLDDAQQTRVAHTRQAATSDLHPVLTPSFMCTSDASAERLLRPLTVTEWSRDWERWVVSARLDDDWTLIGVFEDAEQAFLAADEASERLARPRPRDA